MNTRHLITLKTAINLLKEHAEGDFVSKADAEKSARELSLIITNAEAILPVESIILGKILNEVDRAETKHPNWPTDKVYACTIVAEESGELTRACLQFECEGGKIEGVELEAIQTAATCIRLIKNINN